MPVKPRKGVYELEEWEGNRKEGERSKGDKETILSAAKTQC